MNQGINHKKKILSEVLSRLKREYPDSACSLVHHDPFQLLISTILSAQCTDERVNKVTGPLFQKYPDAHAFASLSEVEIGKLIFSTGFYNNKARSIKATSIVILEEHDGNVPATLEALVKLPGVGRKTANVVLGNAFGIPGVTVDTHVTRLTNLLGFVKTKDAVKIEKELMILMDKTDWTLSAHLFIDHGRAVCIARRPQCQDCILNDVCVSTTV
ncbi:MAG: endonuclease III [Candidatus Marinimicrobia bacterium]|nr:endonuclease III [Candidatus Neomarinimicrobiota bacterium]